MRYSPPPVRTSMSLDQQTLELVAGLAKNLSVSKSEVIRRAVRALKQETDTKTRRPTPAEALERLQNGEGISVHEAEAWKKEVAAERLGTRYWWEEK